MIAVPLPVISTFAVTCYLLHISFSSSVISCNDAISMSCRFMNSSSMRILVWFSIPFIFRVIILSYIALLVVRFMGWGR